MQGILVGTETWKVLIPRLRAVEGLLRNKMNRERFSYACVGAEYPSKQQKLEYFSASLKGLRWHAVSVFCSELLKLEGVLRILGLSYSGDFDIISCTPFNNLGLSDSPSSGFGFPSVL